MLPLQFFKVGNIYNTFYRILLTSKTSMGKGVGET